MSSASAPTTKILVSGDENKVEPSTPTDEGSDDLRSIWTEGEEDESEDEVEGKAEGDDEEVGEVGEEEEQKEAAEGEALDHVGTDVEGQAVAPVGNNAVTPVQVEQQPTPDVQMKEPAEAVVTTEAATNVRAEGATPGPATNDKADGIQERELGPSGRRYHLRSMAERKRQLWGKEDI